MLTFFVLIFLKLTGSLCLFLFHFYKEIILIQDALDLTLGVLSSIKIRLLLTVVAGMVQV